MTVTAAGSYRAQYDLAFQTAPIILYGGIAASAQGGMISITEFTQVEGSDDSIPFAVYLPLPGSTLISQTIGMYPFANQSIAANATIQQPLALSMRMIAPVNQAGGYLTKLPQFTSLQNALQSHNAAGGTYIVATPAFIYSNLLMTAMTDISAGDEKQQQIEWQLDFVQPILTLAGAAAAQNALMGKLTAGTQINGTPAWSGTTQPAPTLNGITAALSQFGGTLV